MNFKDIHHYFKNPPPIYLSQEVAVCCILSILMNEGDSYGTALMKQIKAQHPPYRISDTVLYGSLKFLSREGIIQSYWQNQPGRGRPRRMLSIAPENRDKADQLAQLWPCYLGENSRSIVLETT